MQLDFDEDVHKQMEKDRQAGKYGQYNQRQNYNNGILYDNSYACYHQTYYQGIYN